MEIACSKIPNDTAPFRSRGSERRDRGDADLRQDGRGEQPYVEGDARQQRGQHMQHDAANACASWVRQGGEMKFMGESGAHDTRKTGHHGKHQARNARNTICVPLAKCRRDRAQLEFHIPGSDGRIRLDAPIAS